MKFFGLFVPAALALFAASCARGPAVGLVVARGGAASLDAALSEKKITQEFSRLAREAGLRPVIARLSSDICAANNQGAPEANTPQKNPKKNQEKNLQRAARKTAKFFARKKVRAAVAVTCPDALATAAKNTDAAYPVITPYAAAEPYFSTAFADDAKARAVADFLRARGAARAVIAHDGLRTSENFARVSAQAFADAGGTAALVTVAPETTSAPQVISAVSSYGADAVVFAGTHFASAQVVRALRAAGRTETLVLSDLAATTQFARLFAALPAAYQNDVFIVARARAAENSAALAQWYGDARPPRLAAQIYASFQIAVEAVRRMRDEAAAPDAVLIEKDFSTALGAVRFDERGKLRGLYAIYAAAENPKN